MLRALLLLLTMTALGCAQNIYYFDFDGGNDSTGDGSRSTPWKTITKLNATAVSGDICFLQAGDTFVVRLRPTAANVTVASYGAANGGRATITSTADNQSAWVEVQQITLKDLEFTGDQDGLYIEDNANGLTVIGVDSHTNTQNGVNTAGLGASAATGVGFFLGNNFDDNTSDGFGTRATFQAYVNGGTISGNDEDGASAHENSVLWLDRVAITGGTTAECIHNVNYNSTCYVDRCLITAVDDDCIRIEPSSANTTGKTVVRNSILVLPASGMAASSAVFHLVGTNGCNLLVDSCTVGILNAGANDVWGARYSSTTQTLSITNTAFFAVDDVDNFYFSSSTADLSGVTLSHLRYQALTTQTVPFDLSTGDVAFAAFLTASGAASTSEVGDLGLVDDTDWSDAANVAPLLGSPLIGAGEAQTASLRDDYDGTSTRKLRPWDIGARSWDPTAQSLTVTPVDGTEFRYFTTDAEVVKAWGIAVDPTYLDLTNHETTLEDRLASGVNRLVLQSPSTVLVKIAFGYGTTPAEVDTTLATVESDALILTLSPTPIEIRSARRITSIEAVAATQTTGIALWGYQE